MSDVVLHVCSDFARQGLYLQLVNHLAERDVVQRVYVPVRERAELARQPADREEQVRFAFRQVLGKRHRLLFRAKIRRVYRSLAECFDLAGIGVTHAHFLYSDGAVALRLKQERGVPFITAVRNTDLNFFMRLRPDLRGIADRILGEAERIVFLSPAYREQFLDRLRPGQRADVEARSEVVPNGLAGHWLDSRPPVAREAEAPVRFLYVGDFSANKNVLNLLSGARILAQRLPLTLTLVGGGGNAEADVLRGLDDPANAFASYLGRIDDADALRDIYREHDVFVMPSYTETFGVAYIEALSQGLPVMHSRGQGIDGLFDNGSLSEAVDPRSPDDIALKMEALAKRRESVRADCIEGARGFAWQRIAKRYDEIYRGIRKQACH